MSRSCYKYIWIALAGSLALLGGCAQQGSKVAVEDDFTPVASGTINAAPYVVKAGDTLYGVAASHNLSVARIAELNQLKKPYKLYVGQRLRVSAEPIRVGVMRPSRKQATAIQQADQSTESAEAQRTLARVKGGGAGGSIAGWMWPTTGDVVSAVSPSAGEKRGIDIIGKNGEPVYAAKGGTVVYAGNGLVGYGNLIIVKHDDKFLSAYAHSSRIDVREGQQVKAGQKIAEIGSTGTDRSKLHFQIRRDGQPVDPLQYLPRR